LEHTAWDPDDAAVVADLDPELHGLPIRVPSGVLGKGEEHGGTPIVYVELNSKVDRLGIHLSPAMLGRLLFKAGEVPE
jgi:hypothetical protein